MYPKSIQNLIEEFSKFPGIGPRQAARFVFHLLKNDSSNTDNLIQSLKNLHQNVITCQLCFRAAEADQKNKHICSICSSESRDPRFIAVVEKDADLVSLEKAKNYSGLYHVLGGTVSMLEPEAPQKFHLKELFLRIKNSPSNRAIKEIILALSPTPQGELSAQYIERVLRPLNVKISRLGRGLPTGADLEYADEATLKSAWEGRK
ncbi:MAG: recombination protein RecR [Parcubacteria group bacterium]|nr:recombination protein RecR [Parcubacteria group bacterium]